MPEVMTRIYYKSDAELSLFASNLVVMMMR